MEQRSLVKLDSGLSATYKYGIVAIAASAAGVSVFFLEIMLVGGPVWKAAAVVLACLGVWLWLKAVLSVFRYRVWLDGTTLCIQKAFSVLRSDLATATWVGVDITHTSVLFLGIRESGGRLLHVRLMTAGGRLVPRHQLEAVADALAAGPLASAPQTREALARLGVTR